MPRCSPGNGERSASAAATLMPCPRSERRTRKFQERATRTNFSRDCAKAWGACSGESGGCRKLTRDLFLITAGLMREKGLDQRCSRRSQPFFPPRRSLNYWSEHSFNRRWAARILGQPERAGTLSGIAMPQPAMEEAI